MSKEHFSKPITVQGKPIDMLFAKEYEDPRDSAYLNALKLNKGFDQAAKFAIEYGIERINLIMYTGSNVRVTPHNMPYLYDCVKHACRVLNVDKMPDIYVTENPFINASTTGSANPIIVFHNSILHRLTHEELMFIIGHEIGHIKSEHLQYTLIGDTLLRIGSSLLDDTLIGSLISSGLNLAFYEWERRAEFTADHAGLLVCQDLKAAINALAKIGGYPIEYYDDLNADDFLAQAQDFADFDDSFYNKIIKSLLVMEKDHPWTVLRARELMLWVQSGEYSRVVNRASSWLAKEIDRRADISDRAARDHERSRYASLSAERAYASDKAFVEMPDDDEPEKKGLQFLLAKGQEGLKSLQAHLSENEHKRKLDDQEEAMQASIRAEAFEAQLRSIYRPMTDEEIRLHTAQFIGDLTRIVTD